jgi:hypothetical protein
MRALLSDQAGRGHHGVYTVQWNLSASRRGRGERTDAHRRISLTRLHMPPNESSNPIRPTPITD